MALQFRDQDLPVPPAELLRRISNPFTRAEADSIRAAYDEAGRTGVRCLEQGLAAVGRGWDDFERVLDFGCGPGRIMRLMEPLTPGLELHGIDIDPALIGWAQEHIPFATFAVGPHEPPTPYPDGHFDLVINHSVFTHLDARFQDLWLAELQRVTRPGAFLLLTVHGHTIFNQALADIERAGENAAAYRARLEHDGILFIEEDSYLGSSHPPFYHTAFHAPWYIFEHWHGFFRVAGYLPEAALSHDLVILQRREDGAVAPPQVGHGAAAAAAPVAAPQVDDALAHAAALLADWPEPRSLPGRLRRRALRTETERVQRVTAALVDATRALRDQVDERNRLLGVMPHSLYEQGERINLLRGDLEQSLAALETRLAALESRQA
jgi:SAM-dependent methyltransferase